MSVQLRGTMAVNAAGHLEIGGCDTVELARTFGTPLYVLDEAMVRARCRAYREGFAKAYPNSQVIYAGKALLNTAMCRIVAQEGLFLDVVSGGELYTARVAGFPADRIVFHGNNKSIDELAMALDTGVGRIVVDNFHELDMLDHLTRQKGRGVSVLLRVTPGVEAKTHAHIQTGQEDSKFGFGIADGAARAAVQRVLDSEWLRLEGLHSHIGSQLFDLTSYGGAVRVLFDFLAGLREQTGFVAREVNLGGGLGIRYTKADEPPSPAEYAQSLATFVKDAARAHAYPAPRIFVEPGRSIVGEAGTTLYTIGSSKVIPGVRTYISVDGGMTDNPRVALYGAKYEALIANRAAQPPATTVSVAGKCCESGDMLIWDLDVPQWAPGDVLAVFATGAYNYSMASNYNRLPRPAMLLVYEGKADVIVERERYEDLVRHDRIPPRLNDETVHAARRG